MRVATRVESMFSCWFDGQGMRIGMTARKPGPRFGVSFFGNRFPKAVHSQHPDSFSFPTYRSDRKLQDLLSVGLPLRRESIGWEQAVTSLRKASPCAWRGTPGKRKKHLHDAVLLWGCGSYGEPFFLTLQTVFFSPSLFFQPFTLSI